MCQLDPSTTKFVDKKTQLTLLTTLHSHCVFAIKPYFRSNPKYFDKEKHAQKWAFWTTQNDTLRKIVFGTYKGKSLPLPLVTAIGAIKHDAFRSFFTQRIIVYHNALHAPNPSMVLGMDGSFRIGAAGAKFVEKDFDRIDISTQAIRQADRDGVPTPPLPTPPLIASVSSIAPVSSADDRDPNAVSEEVAPAPEEVAPAPAAKRQKSGSGSAKPKATDAPMATGGSTTGITVRVIPPSESASKIRRRHRR
jgi:hypothetical protein